LRIILINPHTGAKLNTIGLIDTGADECAVPSDYASILGHRLKAVSKKKIHTAGGIGEAYPHTTKIQIPGFTTTDTLIDFTIGLDVVLLGVKSFLSHFKLTVDYRKQLFSLTK
jgi:predicted aspartyl protease